MAKLGAGVVSGGQTRRPVSLGKGLDFIMDTSAGAWQGSKKEVMLINLFQKESSVEDALEAGGSAGAKWRERWQGLPLVAV